MRRGLRLSALVVALAAVQGCGDPPAGIRVEALMDVQVTDEPLSDVVQGELRAGATAVATCFVDRARSNAGTTGSAIGIAAGRTTGYAAVTTLPPDPADRRPAFDADEDALRRDLPACRPRDNG